MARLADPKGPDGKFPFTWVPSTHTNIKETFRRERMRLLEEVKPPSPVRAITDRKRA